MPEGDEDPLSRAAFGGGDSEELRIDQLTREAEERERARAADSPDETGQHERRAEKAEYLRRKLEERSEAERETEI
jgi:hypothetical protein